jgi:hypothetical protein
MSWEEKYKSKYPVKGSTIDPKITPKSAVLRIEPEEKDFCLNLSKEQAWQFEQAMRRNLQELRQRCLDEVLGGKK